MGWKVGPTRMEEFFQKISSLGIFLDQDLIVGNLLGPTFSTIVVVIG